MTSNPDNAPSGSDREQGDEYPRHVVARRVEAAGVSLERFIDVENGRKQSYDHTQRGPDAVSGNYGVTCGSGLVGFDIDDYQEGTDISTIESLPATFTVKTPHGGQHRYFSGSRVVLETIVAATHGSKNVSLNWGEIYAGGKYLVGPGSRITDCNKDGCRNCKIHGGEYFIDEDRSIAEIGQDQVLSILSADPSFSESSAQSTLSLYPGQEEATSDKGYLSDPDLTTLEPAILSEKDPQRKLWMVVIRQYTHCDVETGVTVERILDRAEELGVERVQAGDYLIQFIEEGRLKRSPVPNRVVPAWVDVRSSEGQQSGLRWFQ